LVTVVVFGGGRFVFAEQRVNAQKRLALVLAVDAVRASKSYDLTFLVFSSGVLIAPPSASN
jgi:hypothetical protein